MMLGPKLAASDCSALTLESRGRTLDRRDSRLWTGLHTSGQLQRTLTLSHLPGPAEPLLWIPDIVCGAFNMAARGDARAWDVLKHRVTHTALDSKGQPLA